MRLFCFLLPAFAATPLPRRAPLALALPRCRPQVKCRCCPLLALGRCLVTTMAVPWCVLLPCAGKGRKGKGGEDGAGGGLRYKDFFGPGGDDDEDEEDEDEDEEGGEEGSEGEGEGLDGEEDGEEEEGLLGRRGKGGAGLLSSEGGTEDMEEDEDEEGAKERRQSGRDAGGLWGWEETGWRGL